MNNKIIYVFLIIVLHSCNMDYKDEFHSNGNLKYRSYKKGKGYDSIISFNKKGDINWIKKFHNEDSLFLWKFEDKNLLNEGVMYKNEALGLWNFYKNNHLSIVREYIRIDNHHYLNQAWFFNKNGDTLMNKGSFYNISFNDTIKSKTQETIRFVLENPLALEEKNEVLLIYEAEFYNDRTNNIEKDKDTIIGFRNEILYQVSFDDPGEFKFKGYILERFQQENESRISNHKLYFDKKIKIIK